MSINSRANWIMGYLEALEQSDRVSKRQFKQLKAKFNSFLDEIEEIEIDIDEDDEGYRTKDRRQKEEDNDLPF